MAMSEYIHNSPTVDRV